MATTTRDESTYAVRGVLIGGLNAMDHPDMDIRINLAGPQFGR